MLRLIDRQLRHSLALAFALSLSASTTAAGKTPCEAPPADGDWAVSSPEAAGFDASALCTVLETVASGEANVHAVLVERHGRLVAELYRTGPDRPISVNHGLGNPFASDVTFDADTLHDVRSVSKSVVGLLFGILLAEGKAPGLSSPALDAFPELSDLRTEGREAITFQHLLTMSSGLDWNEWDSSLFTSDETRLFWKGNPTRFVFDRPLAAPPGTKFNYNGGSTTTLAEALTRASGKTLLELVREELFEPLGITEWEWASDLRGRPLAFAGLRLRPRDMLKLGRLVLDHGRWGGQQIVPETWVSDSLRSHVSTGIRFLAISPEEVGYGYQWWNGSIPWRGRNLLWIAAFGNGGQRIFVLPELDMIVVTTAGDYGSLQIARAVGTLFAEIVAAAGTE